MEKIYPYNEAGKIQIIRKYGQLISEEYVAEGTLMELLVDEVMYERIKEYVVKE